MRGLRLSWLFFRIGMLNEMQYRVNFFLQLFQSLVSLGTAVGVLLVVFRFTNELGGWSPYELLAVMGVHIAMGGIIGTVIQPNMERLMTDIREGTLDYALTKPEDAQLLVSTRNFRIWRGVDLLVGGGVIAVAVVKLGRGLDPLAALAFVAAMLLGAVMIYCFWLALTVGAFWIVRMEFIVELFEGVYQAGRWPVTIYPGWLRIGFTFLVPLAFAVTVPAEAVTGRLTWQTLAGAAVFAVILFAATRLWWRVALRHYSGASA